MLRMLELSPKIEKQWNAYIRKLARSEPQMDDGVILKHKSRLQARIGATICILVDVYS
jgi:hypothetical protein